MENFLYHFLQTIPQLLGGSWSMLGDPIGRKLIQCVKGYYSSDKTWIPTSSGNVSHERSTYRVVCVETLNGHG